MAKKIGLTLSAGAARGWAHVGVLRALEEMGVKPDIITGTSVGALVGGAYLLGALDEFEGWGRTLSPLSALRDFSFKLTSGGFINAESAFSSFAEFDQPIEELSTRYGAVACDLGSGEEVEITTGSVLHAARASSAIPILLQAIEHQGRWLVDGAIVNPTPVSLARKLGADVVIAVDLNAVPKALTRFSPDVAHKTPPSSKETEEVSSSFSGTIKKLIADTRASIDHEIGKARAKIDAKPHIFETAMAVTDTIQMQLSRIQAQTHPADISLSPDMREALPNAFDRADEFIETGRLTMLDQAKTLEQLL